MIPVDSIVIPDPIIRLCGRWKGGAGCMLNTVYSVAMLRLGDCRPVGCDTDEKWYYTIWREFADDLAWAAKQAKSFGDVDADELNKAKEWSESICTDLEESYGLSTGKSE